MSCQRLEAGANLLVNRKLYEADGTTPLATSSVASAKVELWQKGVMKTSINLGPSNAYRAGTDGYSVDLEYTTTITGTTLEKGPVLERHHLRVTDTDFVAEPNVAVHVIEVQEIIIT